MDRYCLYESYASLSSFVSTELDREPLAHYNSLLIDAEFVCIKDGWEGNRRNFLIEIRPPNITISYRLFLNGTLIMAMLYRMCSTQYRWGNYRGAESSRFLSTLGESH